MFRRVELRRIRRGEDQPDFGRNADLSAVMPSGPIQHEKDVFLFVPPPQFLKEDLSTGSVHMGEDQSVQSSVMRRPGRIVLGKLLDDLDLDQGTNGKRSPTTPGISDQPELGLVLEHEPLGLIGFREGGRIPER